MSQSCFTTCLGDWISGVTPICHPGVSNNDPYTQDKLNVNVINACMALSVVHDKRWAWCQPQVCTESRMSCVAEGLTYQKVVAAPTKGEPADDNKARTAITASTARSIQGMDEKWADREKWTVKERETHVNIPVGSRMRCSNWCARANPVAPQLYLSEVGTTYNVVYYRRKLEGWQRCRRHNYGFEFCKYPTDYHGNC